MNGIIFCQSFGKSNANKPYISSGMAKSVAKKRELFVLEMAISLYICVILHIFFCICVVFSSAPQNDFYANTFLRAKRKLENSRKLDPNP